MAMMSSPKMLGFRTSSTARRITGTHGSPGDSDSLRWTFSTWMIAASTIMPMEMASPPSEIRFAVRPVAFMTPKTVNAASGSIRITTRAPRTLRRKRYSTTKMNRVPSTRARTRVRMALSTTSLRS